MKKSSPLQFAGFIIILISITLSGKILIDYLSFDSLPSHKKLMVLWEKDIANLKEAKQLPRFWNNIRSVKMIPGDSRAKKWVKKIKPPVATKKEGQFDMEILVLGWKDDEDGSHGAIIQYDVTEIRKQNLIWELGRTFYFDKGTPKKKTQPKKAAADQPPSNPEKSQKQ